MRVTCKEDLQGSAAACKISHASDTKMALTSCRSGFKGGCDGACVAGLTVCGEQPTFVGRGRPKGRGLQTMARACVCVHVRIGMCGRVCVHMRVC
jgi:hypothetical protein